jgi:hypothetical protein
MSSVHFPNVPAYIVTVSQAIKRNNSSRGTAWVSKAERAVSKLTPRLL